MICVRVRFVISCEAIEAFCLLNENRSFTISRVMNTLANMQQKATISAFYLMTSLNTFQPGLFQRKIT